MIEKKSNEQYPTPKQASETKLKVSDPVSNGSGVLDNNKPLDIIPALLSTKHVGYGYQFFSTAGVFAAIFNDQKQILLCHRTDRDLWNLVGGRVEQNELPHSALLREIQEEIVCQAKLLSLSGIYNKVAEREIVFCYIAKIVSGIPSFTNEADDIKYFDVDSLPPNIAPKQIQRIIDAYNYDHMVIIRDQ